MELYPKCKESGCKKNSKHIYIFFTFWKYDIIVNLKKRKSFLIYPMFNVISF